MHHAQLQPATRVHSQVGLHLLARLPLPAYPLQKTACLQLGVVPRRGQMEADYTYIQALLSLEASSMAWASPSLLKRLKVLLSSEGLTCKGSENFHEDTKCAKVLQRRFIARHEQNDFRSASRHFELSIQHSWPIQNP